MERDQKPTEQQRKAAVREWSNTPSPNPRYRGATPGDVARALLGKKPVRRDAESDENDPAVKTDI